MFDCGYASGKVFSELNELRIVFLKDLFWMLQICAYLVINDRVVS